ncbi:MAG: hypothetical protein IPP47_03780 [Bryobacterales bacterium]|nr:hypothetical protein [Bryobacterales bacterium]
MLRGTLIFFSLAGLWAQVPRSQCFPVEDLAPDQRQRAEELFLKLMDSEAIYTVIGGVKPMSSGFARFQQDASATENAPLDEARSLLARFQCGQGILATVQHFAAVYPNTKTNKLERPFEAVVFHTASLRRLIGERSDFFTPGGITPHAHPIETSMMVEYLPKTARLEGLGLLYGYPREAIRFFVDATRSQERTGVFVERDFVSLPTFARAERGVVYAVPKGHVSTSEDQRFRRSLEPILDTYRERRARFIGDGLPGIVALLRDWFCSENACALPAGP